MPHEERDHAATDNGADESEKMTIVEAKRPMVQPHRGMSGKTNASTASAALDATLREGISAH